MNWQPVPSPKPPDLPKRLPIRPLEGPVDLDIQVPGSKSMTNRYLVQAALAEGEVTLNAALFADDTLYMCQALEALGFKVQTDPVGQRIRVYGRSGLIPKENAELMAGNAGTVMRFLTALVCLGEGKFRLDGLQRMRERPIKDLVDALQGIQIKIHCENENDCPPVIVEAAGLPGGRVRIDGSNSSQYISALLMIAPYAAEALEVEVIGDFVSRPYVELTLQVMAEFGVGTMTEGERIYRPVPGKYHAGEYEVEGDATAASYFLGAAAIMGGRVAITNVKADSSQGDVGFANILGRMGCKVRRGFLSGNRGIEVSRDPNMPLKAINTDLNDMPDVAQTLATVCMFAEGTSTMIGLGNLRIKETDRLAALGKELAKLGAGIDEGQDYLEITPGPHQPAHIDTYDDHRMAMALSLVGLGREGVVINDPACVAKTYPNYFDDLEKLRA